MEMLGGIVTSLVPLVVLAAIVAALISWRRKEAIQAEADEGIGTVRRLYFYFATFGYMMVASVGVVLVVAYLLDETLGPERLNRDVTRVALGVALAVIWAPIWAWHRQRVRRLLTEEPAERSSVLRKVSIYLTLTVTAGLVIQASIELLRWMFRASSFYGYPFAAAAVWSALWVLTWQQEQGEGQPTDDTRTVRRLYIYAFSAVGLVMLAGGAGGALGIVLREAYEGIVPVPAFLAREESLWSEDMKGLVAVTVVGTALWSTHWLGFGRKDNQSDIRLFYLYVLALLGGVVTTLSGAGTILYGVLEWWFGTPEWESAARHFRLLPGAITVVAVGALLWAYHWTVIHQERAAAGQLQGAQRIYRYVMATLGLGALAGMLITLIPTVLAILVTDAQEVLVGPDWWRDRIALATTLGLLGAPVWGYHWWAAQRSVSTYAVERNSLPRRILVYGVLALGTLAALGSVSHLVFTFLNAGLENRLSLTLLRDAKWSIGVLSAALVIAPYYWFVMLEDRELAAPAADRERPRKSVALLVAKDARTLIDQLEAELDTKLRVLERTDVAAIPSVTLEALTDLRRRIEEAPGERVLLVADEQDVRVYPYR
jgi:hypothetical protein